MAYRQLEKKKIRLNRIYQKKLFIPYRYMVKKKKHELKTT